MNTNEKVLMKGAQLCTAASGVDGNNKSHPKGADEIHPNVVAPENVTEMKKAREPLGDRQCVLKNGVTHNKRNPGWTTREGFSPSSASGTRISLT